MLVFIGIAFFAVVIIGVVIHCRPRRGLKEYLLEELMLEIYDPDYLVKRRLWEKWYYGKK